MILDFFDEVKIRDMWFDKYGLDRPIEKVERVTRPKRKETWVASVVVALSLTASALLYVPAAQAVMMWPTQATAESAKMSLHDSLSALKTLGQDWTGNPGCAPQRESIAAAQRVITMLPNVTVKDAKVGVDGDGHVYLRLGVDSKIAYLTIEPRSLHLYFTDGLEKVYIDDQKFRGDALPGRIAKVLSAKLA